MTRITFLVGGSDDAPLMLQRGRAKVEQQPHALAGGLQTLER
jgi:hypothetical protein